MERLTLQDQGTRALAWGRGQMLAAGTAGVVVLVVLAAFLFKGCGGPDKPKINPVTQKSIDSLKATDSAFKHQKDSIITIVKYDTAQAVVLQKQAQAANKVAEQSKATAKVLGHTADSLAAIARLHADSALLWRGAYDKRTQERDTLLVTIVQKDSAISKEHASFVKEQDARIGLGLLYGADTTRRLAVEKVNSGLIKDIAKLQQPCTVPGTFGKIPCPSRTVTMLLTAGSIIGGQALINSAKSQVKP